MKFQNARDVSFHWKLELITIKVTASLQAIPSYIVSLLAIFLYLATRTRPDIGVSVIMLALHNENPKEGHEKGVRRVLRYLKDTNYKAIHLTPGKSDQLNVSVDRF